MPRRIATLLVCLVAVPLATLVLYFAAAFLLGVIPLHRDDPPVPGGIDVYLRTNGIHVDVIVPFHAAEVDWTTRLPMEALDPVAGITVDLAFGWGDRAFYLETPTWADLRLTTAMRALTGLDPTVLHVEAVPIPKVGANTRHLQLSPDRYRDLAAFIDRSFRRTADGAVIPVPDAHYGWHDAFFEAEGRYSLITTCNDWTRRALSAAGVRVPVWSPFDKALFYQLPPDPVRP